MRTSMAFPIRFWATLLAALLVYQFSTDASADGCGSIRSHDVQGEIETPKEG